MNNKTKKKILSVSALFLVLVCYFIVVSLIVPYHEAAYIIASLFSFIAVLMQASSYLLLITDPPIEEYFYRIPAVYTGMIYIVIQFIAGFIVSLFNFSARIALIIEIPILAIFGAVELYMLFASIHAKDLNKKMNHSVSGMRLLSAEAKSIVSSAPDYEWRCLAKSVLDEIQYADPVTTEKTEILERDLHIELNNIKNAVLQKDRSAFDTSFQNIKEILAERNI